jgi:hypothetical protein
MLKKPEPITILNIDGKPVVVAELSEEIQNAVELYNHFREEEVVARAELRKVQGAVFALSQEIVMAARKTLTENDDSVDSTEEAANTEDTKSEE